MVSVSRLDSITDYKGSALKLPNSVAVFDDGRVAVADGGNNRVCVFDVDGHGVWEHAPGAGFSETHLREPIFVAVSPNQELYVSDWHNHRFVVFDQALKFSHALFHLGDVSARSGLKRFIFNLEVFVKHLLTRHVGASHYFTKGEMFDGALKVLDVFCDKGRAVRKPNGIVFQPENKRIIITQKANRCLSIYHYADQSVSLDKHIHVFDGMGFGRLCNLTMDAQGRIFVCDQNNGRIVAYDADLNPVTHFDYDLTDDKPMAPFGCAIIDDDILAAAWSFGIELRRISTGEVLWACNDLGETHGIAWDKARRILYYVDRSNSAIVPFLVGDFS